MVPVYCSDQLRTMCLTYCCFYSSQDNHRSYYHDERQVFLSPPQGDNRKYYQQETKFIVRMLQENDQAIFGPKIPALIQEPEPELERFYVTLEKIFPTKNFEGNVWMKYPSINDEVIVIADCMEKMTVGEFVAKCRKFNENLSPGHQWRVFFQQYARHLGLEGRVG